MTVVQHIIGPAAFPAPPPPLSQSMDCLSVLSYNILLPNSVDGWWNYKMYLPPLSDENQEIASWDYRRNLLRQRIAAVDADVVCLQEVSPLSFDDDFAFMAELGYDGHEMFKKGRFRPASFWKTSRCQLRHEAVHKDRTLLTAFERVATNENETGPSSSQSTTTANARSSSSSSSSSNTWYVLNCHLQAGKQGSRRLRQINEGVKSVATLAKKLKDVNALVDQKLRLIVCGDFNGGAECAAVRFLEDGWIDETFLEDGEAVSSGRKALPAIVMPLRDAVTSTSRNGDDNQHGPPPSTLVVPELMSTMIRGGSYENLDLSDEVIERLTKIYHRLATLPSPNKVKPDDTNGDSRATTSLVMSVSDVERFLVAINGQVGRGSEFREAARQMGWVEPENAKSTSTDADENQDDDDAAQRITLPPNGVLSLEGFCVIYQAELAQGKFWGIAHDLAVLGEPLPDAGVFTSRFDRMYHSTALQPTAVMDFVCQQPCPNAQEPSDHLPVAVSFTVSSI